MRYNREPIIGDRDPWKSLFINIDNPSIGQYRPSSIVSICGSEALHRHEITFLTGASFCRAHAVAKMLAAAVIHGSYPFVPSLMVAKPDEQNTQQRNNRVLWIDSVHSYYTCCGIIDDFKRSFGASNENFRLMCLDGIGVFNECDETVLFHITDAIRDFKPALVVIDDVDHLAAECGAYRADNFYLEMREILDYHDTALLCVGYNLMGRAKSTAGFIGKRLFAIANNVYRVTNRGTLSILQRVKAISHDDQFQFAFSVNDQNFPQQVLMKPDTSSAAEQFAEATTVQDVFSEVITPDETLTPDQLVTRLNKRQTELNQLNRNRYLIADALARGVISRNDEGNYTINPKARTNCVLTDDHNRRWIEEYMDKLHIHSKIKALIPDKKPDDFSYFNKRAHFNPVPENLKIQDRSATHIPPDNVVP